MNGQVTYSSLPNNTMYEIGTLAEHTCSAGFTLIGIANRTCLAFDQADAVGDWTQTAPSCQRKTI